MMTDNAEMQEPAEAAPETSPPAMLYLDSVPGAENLPPAGEITLKYKLGEHNHRTSGDGTESHSVCLEILGIVNAESDEDEAGEVTGSDDRGAELDKIASEETAKAKKPAVEEEE